MNDKGVSISTTEKSTLLGLDRGPFITFLGAASTVALYVIARAYHDGYLNFFGLSSSMFPMQAGDVTMYAVMALLTVLKSLLDFVFGINFKAALYFSGCAALFILLVGSMGLLISYFNSRKTESPGRAERFLNLLLHSSAIHWVMPAFGLFFAAFVVFFAAVSVCFLILIFIYPFIIAGETVAREDLQKGFNDSPVASFKTPTGGEEKFHLIECATQFCAFFGGGKVITIAVSDVKWLTSDVPFYK